MWPSASDKTVVLKPRHVEAAKRAMETWACSNVAIVIEVIVCVIAVVFVLISLLLVHLHVSNSRSWLRITTGIAWVAVFVIGFLLPFHVRLNGNSAAAFISLLFITGGAQIYLICSKPKSEH